MKNKWLIILLIFSLAVNIAAIVTIGYNWYRTTVYKRNFRRDHENFARRFNNEFGISDEQQKAFFENQKEMFEKLKPYREAIREHRKTIFDLLNSPEIDTIKLNQQLDSLETYQKEVQKISLMNFFAQRRFLSNEQYSKILKKFGHRLMNPYFDGPPMRRNWNSDGEKGEMPPPGPRGEDMPPLDMPQEMPPPGDRQM